MKRIIFIFLAAMMSTAVCSAAMSNSKVRKETRFLTDKMAYELNLSTEQYNDVYEINYDFISGIRYLMDDVLRGEEWALNRYYDYLDVRNDDLRWVLNNRQYGRFMQAAYFYRPVYVSGGRWSFRVYITYTNHNHFYFLFTRLSATIHTTTSRTAVTCTCANAIITTVATSRGIYIIPACRTLMRIRADVHRTEI